MATVYEKAKLLQGLVTGEPGGKVPAFIPRGHL
jgi:hypothetical protein